MSVVHLATATLHLASGDSYGMCVSGTIKNPPSAFWAGVGEGVPNIRSRWASSISWYDVSHYLWLCNFQVFSLPSQRNCELLKILECLSSAHWLSDSFPSFPCSTLCHTRQLLWRTFPKILCQQICRAWNLCNLGTLLYKNSSKL